MKNAAKVSKGAGPGRNNNHPWQKTL